MKFKEIVAIATEIKTYVEKHKNLPSKARGIHKGKYAYLLCKSILNPGKDIIELNYSYAPNPNGDTINKTLTKKEYQSIANDVNKFVSSNKRLPNYDNFQNKHINIDMVTYCMAKIIVFYNKNNRLPNTCEFNSNIFKSTSKTSSGYTTKGGTVCKKLVNICKMSINNYTDIYHAMSKFKYEYYYNDVKPQSKTLSDMAGNCTDLNQIEYTALKELKYNVRIVRGLVRCNDGKNYGHVWCQIQLNGKWTNIDASAAAKGKSLGNVICSKVVEITNINPSWAVSDDGRT